MQLIYRRYVVAIELIYGDDLSLVQVNNKTLFCTYDMLSVQGVSIPTTSMPMSFSTYVDQVCRRPCAMCRRLVVGLGYPDDLTYCKIKKGQGHRGRFMQCNHNGQTCVAHSKKDYGVSINLNYILYLLLNIMDAHFQLGMLSWIQVILNHVNISLYISFFLCLFIILW